MRKLLLAFLLVGCASTVFASPHLPTFLAGEWVRSDFKAAADDDAEPQAGSAIYLLENGHAMVWCPIAGVPCLATYQEKESILRLKEVPVDPGPFTPTVVRYAYDPKAKTLKALRSGPSDSTAFLKLETYKRRRTKVPRFFRQILRQPWP